MAASSSAAGRLLLQVSDSGIGFSAAGLPRIFDEFFRTQSQRPLAPHQCKGLGPGRGLSSGSRRRWVRR